MDSPTIGSFKAEYPTLSAGVEFLKGLVQEKSPSKPTGEMIIFNEIGAERKNAYIVAQRLNIGEHDLINAYCKCENNPIEQLLGFTTDANALANSSIYKLFR